MGKKTFFMKKIIVLAIMGLMACGLQARQLGALPAKFKVADGKYVYFSQGNLQYARNSSTWSFADRQYDAIGDANISDGALADKIDLFGWSSDGSSVVQWGASVSTDNTLFNGNFSEWGNNAISNGGNTAKRWRTLTSDEWQYLFKHTRWTVGYVAGTLGFILLPDEFSAPSGITVNIIGNGNLTESTKTYTLDNANNYTESVFAQLQKLGVVFLPCGYRNGTTVTTSGNGYYWSTSAQGTTQAKHIQFGTTSANFGASANRCMGYYVRLVQDDQANMKPLPAKFELSDGTKIAFATGNLTYDPTTNIYAPAKNQYDYLGVATGKRDLLRGDLGELNFCEYKWRIPSISEWQYLFQHYPWTMAKVNGVYGFMLLPKNFQTPTGLSVTLISQGGYTGNTATFQASVYASNTYSATQFAQLQTAGAVFLPFAGKSYDSTYPSVESVGSSGFYWSSTSYTSEMHYCCDFQKESVNLTQFRLNQHLQSIRNIVTCGSVHIGQTTHGTVSASGTEFPAGETVTLDIKPDDGYKAGIISLKNGNQTTVITSNEFTMPSGDVTVSVLFVPTDAAETMNLITIVTEDDNVLYKYWNAPETAGITVSHGSRDNLYIHTMSLGTRNYYSGTLSIRHDDNYRVIKTEVETIDGSQISTHGSEKFEFTMPASPVVIKVACQRLYKIDTSIEGKGNLRTNNTAIEGETVTLNATPAPGYQFSQLSAEQQDGTPIEIDNSQLTMPASDIKVTAVFEPIDYNINIESDEAKGGVSASKLIAHIGDSIKITVAPQTGYAATEIHVWQETNEIPLTDSTFVMPAGDVTISIVWARIFIITVNPSVHGTVSALPTANEGDSVTIEIEPDLGYELDNLIVLNGGSRLAVTNGRFKMPAGDVSIYAKFRPIYYTITIEPTDNGTVVATPTQAKINDLVVLEIQPEQGFVLSQLFVFNGDELVEVTNNQFVMPAGNISVTAWFDEGTTTALDSSEPDASNTTVQKIIRNGQVLIVRDGKTYTLFGIEIKD